MLIPALDLIAGQVVRLQQGDFNRQTTYASDPLPLVQKYQDAGADWLHLVDLDGAKDPQQRQLALLQRLTAATSMKVQVGGGIRSVSDVEALLQSGVTRVVIGSLAVREPELVESWFQQFGAEAIVLALDVHIDAEGIARVATHGWQQTSTTTLNSIIERFLACGLKHVLCTDISRDGMLSGANTELYAALKRDYPTIELQASGGIATLADLEQLQAVQCDSAILGKSLLTGQFTLEEALLCWPNASSPA
ncbi:1-(5-phosphoribosyl)-5-[(5-phosphoribosylamino)methylideneamino]imidazole-4-carboxamide isomerase [Pseudidiomarina aestuarii]|uniref:1-(5-phosphoribosyl)-5-[(5-phosphoribosylamino)methylideneamino] imidazole-4-carboxamide isomerase n=1 Tax=Pseudidiomarina aestuarii TaxID=624146 RepID=A0A7Z6ZU77_9GAMM|nr:1-(5-phosphoribosyl)-5-[(5-phosphoribosylamino)methylideneamino]imidazole-4-carboxamide isomerase [Pseudidiomarina aestuarii]RUO41327.1 1-(5-phosphoribosyl)-5-[(5-phosphoribosylamino)methylideneamino]imidazole-4-carboxamide isomerase [Pseudidiomarina aestuarii]